MVSIEVQYDSSQVQPRVCTHAHAHTYPQGVFLSPLSFLQGIIMTSARATPT